MYRTVLLFALLASVSSAEFSQNKTRTNLEIFEEAISAGLEKLYYNPGVNRNVQFIFVIMPDEKGGANIETLNRARFMNNLVKKTASENNLSFSITDRVPEINPDSTYNIMILQVLNLETRYTGFRKNKFLGEKTVSRNIVVNIEVQFRANPSGVNFKDYIKYDMIDEISLDNYEQMESPLYDFTRGEAPKISSFERIIFPVLLICVTAAATILFFTIRSK